MEHVERIGRTRVLSVEKQGGFVLKILESPMDIDIPPPDSDAAKGIARAMLKRDEAEKKKNKKTKKKKNWTIRQEMFSDHVDIV